MDMKRDLLGYLIKNSDKETSEALDLLRYELESVLTYYGNHFKIPRESQKRKYFSQIKAYIEYFIITISKKKKKNDQKNILSSAHSIWNNHFSSEGFNVFSPPWNVNRRLQCNTSLKLYLITKEIQIKLNSSDFNYLISKEFIKLINKYYILLKKECISNCYDALIIRDYNSFFEKVCSKIFRELNKPVFFWHHGGIPANYNPTHKDRADYFVIMGQKQVDHFIQMGYPKTQFLISGHPVYNEKPDNLKFNLSKILIITKAPSGADPLEESVHPLRGNSIMYLYSIQRVLKSLGVKSVKLRPHPSENYNWYKKMIDTSFYIKDDEKLELSLQNSTLVIGPISTTIIDSLYHGINYVLYEPIIKDRTILGNPITPPLDGSDPRLPTAHSEKTLKKIIKENIAISKDIYSEFVKTPRDISFLKKLI